MRIGIWCSYGRTLVPTEGIGVFTHAIARGFARLAEVEDVQLVVHAGDEPLVASTVAASAGRIHVASLRRQSWGDRWRWKALRRRHRKLCDRLATGGRVDRLVARRDRVEHAIDAVFARQVIDEPEGVPSRDVWLLPHVAVERRFAAPVVVVVHDMVPFHFAGVIKPRDLESFRRRSCRIVHEAALVGTMSQTIRDVDIVGHLGSPREKVRVVSPAVPDDLGSPAPPDDVLRAIPAAARPFLLYPAAWRPYKNHARLVDAVALLRQRGYPDLELVLTGFAALPHELAAIADRLGLASVVHAVGQVDRPMLAGLYRAAAVTVVPSLYEQGSFPVLEAIQCGCPAVASDIPAFREVFEAFNGAIPMFDPLSPASIASGVGGVLADRAVVLRRQQAAMSSRSWEDAAIDWLAVLREAARTRPA
ncbi:MAG: glycosyltransferase family 4 protein [Planctomycetes bacterium]|nr:glycosyltransferase family 4 protein [Planctomycetota bacterium]